jgi:restriction system protein
MPPAHYLYDGERGPRLLAAARDGVWGVDTRPHLAFVQAKRWTKNVGIKAVQEANAAPAVYGCSNAMVVTNRYFTDAAKKLASANDVALWDRDHLVKALLAARDS